MGVVCLFCVVIVQCEIPEGSTVPKCLYRTAEELESEENRLLTDSIYKSASVFKGAPYEVQSQLPDPYHRHHL